MANPTCSVIQVAVNAIVCNLFTTCDISLQHRHSTGVSWQEVKKCNFGAPYLASFKFIFVIFDVFHHYANISLYFNQNMHWVKSHRSYPLKSLTWRQVSGNN